MLSFAVFYFTFLLCLSLSFAVSPSSVSPSLSHHPLFLPYCLTALVLLSHTRFPLLLLSSSTSLPIFLTLTQAAPPSFVFFPLTFPLACLYPSLTVSPSSLSPSLSQSLSHSFSPPVSYLYYIPSHFVTQNILDLFSCCFPVVLLSHLHLFLSLIRKHFTATHTLSYLLYIAVDFYADIFSFVPSLLFLLFCRRRWGTFGSAALSRAHVTPNRDIPRASGRYWHALSHLHWMCNISPYLHGHAAELLSIHSPRWQCYISAPSSSTDYPDFTLSSIQRAQQRVFCVLRPALSSCLLINADHCRFPTTAGPH